MRSGSRDPGHTGGMDASVRAFTRPPSSPDGDTPMTAPAWMPLYIADYLADTGHLTTEEHGAYFLLIMHYWRNGGLPTDDVRLARITRLSNTKWRKIRPIIGEFFSPDWKHKRIDAELAECWDLLAKRSLAGKAGASVRHSKRIANAVQTQTPSPSPSPSPIEETLTETLSADADRSSGNGSDKQKPAKADPQTPVGKGRYPDAFEFLWDTYRAAGNRNATKADAFKAWKRLPQGEQTACFDGLLAYVMWLMEERKKRPDTPAKHLATFINKRGWEPFMEEAHGVH